MRLFGSIPAHRLADRLDLVADALPGMEMSGCRRVVRAAAKYVRHMESQMIGVDDPRPRGRPAEPPADIETGLTKQTVAPSSGMTVRRIRFK